MKGGENLNNMKKGFTLIELLIVIAIIAIIAGAVLVAINPAKRIGESNNAARWAELNSLGSAAAQYVVDNGGNTPQCNDEDDIPSTYTQICEDCGDSATSGDADADDEVECDLGILVDNGYLSSIAVDPTASTSDATPGITYYYVKQDANDTICFKTYFEYDLDPGLTNSTIEVCR